MKAVAASRRFWKIALSVMLFLGMATVGYTVGRDTSAPDLPDEMVMPLMSAKGPQDATQLLVSNFTRARSLSEDYLIETEARELVNIEVQFNQHIAAIEVELSRLAGSDDEGLEILVSNLMRLKTRMEQDAKTSFKLHRRELGYGG
jgi:hypothetical protein